MFKDNLKNQYNSDLQKFKINLKPTCLPVMSLKTEKKIVNDSNDHLPLKTKFTNNNNDINSLTCKSTSSTCSTSSSFSSSSSSRGLDFSSSTNESNTPRSFIQTPSPLSQQQQHQQRQQDPEYDQQNNVCSSRLNFKNTLDKFNMMNRSNSSNSTPLNPVLIRPRPQTPTIISINNYTNLHFNNTNRHYNYQNSQLSSTITTTTTTTTYSPIMNHNSLQNIETLDNSSNKMDYQLGKSFYSVKLRLKKKKNKDNY
jgi:hypothetical protein